MIAIPSPTPSAIPIARSPGFGKRPRMSRTATSPSSGTLRPPLVARQHTLRLLRPPRPDIAIPPLPAGAEWVGEPIGSIDRLVATRPVLVHFFDLAQLNSVRTVPYLRGWHDRYSGDGLALVGVHSPRFPFTQGLDVVAAAVERLGIEWPVIADPEF